MQDLDPAIVAIGGLVLLSLMLALLMFGRMVFWRKQFRKAEGLAEYWEGRFDDYVKEAGHHRNVLAEKTNGAERALREYRHAVSTLTAQPTTVIIDGDGPRMKARNAEPFSVTEAKRREPRAIVLDPVDQVANPMLGKYLLSAGGEVPNGRWKWSGEFA